MKNALIALLALLVFQKTAAQTPALQLIGHFKFDSTTLAGCWHHVDAKGNEYALVGTSKGLSIIDLNDPAKPVERFKIPGLPNNWREVKTWKNFAYVGSEAPGSGITIVDLNHLPDSVSHRVWTGDGLHAGKITSSHSLQCEAGYLYIFGGSMLTNGAIICSLADPLRPQVIGLYTENYLHDGFVRGDTLWGSEIYKGQFSVVDISDKSKPKLLQTQPTPALFNHNSWLSDDGKYLFTTDERTNAPMTSFKVEDINDIQILDTYFPSGNPSREVHNVRGLGDFLVNPSYGGQLTLVDASRPDNLVEVGFASLGQSLVWDANPYLPSGLVFATAKNEGLFIFEPTYRQAAFLEGKIVDASTGEPVGNAQVKIVGMPKIERSQNSGEYKTGASSEGKFEVVFEKVGYETLQMKGVKLERGKATEVNAALQPMALSAKTVRSLPNFQLSPTLVSSEILVIVPDEGAFSDKKSKITVSNLHGQEFIETMVEGSATRLENLDNLPAGHYLVTVRDENGRCAVRRFVKN